MSRRSLTLLPVLALIAGTLFASAPPANALHPDCALSGGAWAGPTGPGTPAFTMNAQAVFKCDGSHRRSESRVSLQIFKNGQWRTEDSSTRNECCDQKVYKSYWLQTFCDTVGGDWRWRVQVSYWFLYNDSGDVAHERLGVTAYQWTSNCVG